MVSTFSAENYYQFCDILASSDDDLKLILTTYGYPPMWTRPNTFETLVHIILEQQVSLASALSAMNKLRDKIKVITPEKILALTDEELKACYFSRQKTSYVRYLAEALLSKAIHLTELEKMESNEVRFQMNKLKGIGNWTIDIYLMFVLQRVDIFPIGDLAAVNALKQLKRLSATTTREQVLEFTVDWHPYRTVATMLLWHYYLSLRLKKQPQFNKSTH
jgi:DNA-3-methyladenine glycosylase II